MTDAITKTESYATMLRPRTMGELESFAKHAAASDLVPKDYKGKPGNIIIAVMMGAEVGFAPLQSLPAIAVINGRGSLYGDAITALLLAHPSVLSFKRWFDEKTQTGHALLRRRNREGGVDEYPSQFSMTDAKQAKLLGKQGPWTDYPRRMCEWRAVGFCARDGAADILKGMASAEEQLDIVQGRVVEEPTPSALRAPSRPSATETQQTRGERGDGQRTRSPQGVGERRQGTATLPSDVEARAGRMGRTADERGGHRDAECVHSGLPTDARQAGSGSAPSNGNACVHRQRRKGGRGHHRSCRCFS